jgi:hypothetical protein
VVQHDTRSTVVALHEEGRAVAHHDARGAMQGRSAAIAGKIELCEWRAPHLSTWCLTKCSNSSLYRVEPRRYPIKQKIEWLCSYYQT